MSARIIQKVLLLLSVELQHCDFQNLVEETVFFISSSDSTYFVDNSIPTILEIEIVDSLNNPYRNINSTLLIEIGLLHIDLIISNT